RPRHFFAAPMALMLTRANLAEEDYPMQRYTAIASSQGVTWVGDVYVLTGHFTRHSVSQPRAAPPHQEHPRCGTEPLQQDCAQLRRYVPAYPSARSCLA